MKICISSICTLRSEEIQALKTFKGNLNIMPIPQVKNPLPTHTQVLHSKKTIINILTFSGEKGALATCIMVCMSGQRQGQKKQVKKELFLQLRAFHSTHGIIFFLMAKVKLVWQVRSHLTESVLHQTLTSYYCFGDKPLVVKSIARNHCQN